MKALVVYESMFGNTRAIAEAIGAGLGEHVPVETVEVGEAPRELTGFEMLVVGGPTHAFSMSRAGTRESALKETDQPLVSRGSGIREWLDDLDVGADVVRAATFDTKVAKPNLPGSAAGAAQKRLRKLRLRIIAPAETFLVEGMTGPLLADEADRARRWGEHLASSFASTS